MVEVFRTNINCENSANQIVNLIISRFPSLKVNFDLEDRDNILRVEGKINTEIIIQMILQNGYECEILE